jgi:hypothetical protein
MDPDNAGARAADNGNTGCPVSCPVDVATLLPANGTHFIISETTGSSIPVAV